MTYLDGRKHNIQAIVTVGKAAEGTTNLLVIQSVLELLRLQGCRSLPTPARSLGLNMKLAYIFVIGFYIYNLNCIGKVFSIRYLNTRRGPVITSLQACES